MERKITDLPALLIEIFLETIIIKLKTLFVYTSAHFDRIKITSKAKFISKKQSIKNKKKKSFYLFNVIKGNQ